MNRERKSLQFVIVIVLMLIGLICSLYLSELFIKVQAEGGKDIDSFCVVNEGFNCVTVANSKWAIIMRVPTAFWGVEYYLALMAFAILSFFSLWPFRKWQSILFWANALSIPFCIFLEYVCVAFIKSICVLCVTVHTVNLVTTVFLAVAHRKRLMELLAEGPLEALDLLKTLPHLKYASAALVLAGASQIIWMPFLLFSSAPQKAQWHGIPVSGFSIGRADAPIKIEEFTDFQCPFCGKAHHVIMEILNKYPDKIYLTHRDYPLDIECNPYLKKPFHPEACKAAMYARCAAKQNLFRPMEHLVFGNRFNLQKSDLEKYAEQAGCDMDEFHQCLEDPETMRALQEDIHEAKRRGLDGTPTFYVNGLPVVGYQPVETWDETIAEILGE